MHFIIKFSLIIILISAPVTCTDYFVILTTNGPVVQGAELTFTAQIYKSNGEVPTDTIFRFVWNDEAIPSHDRERKGKIVEDIWSLSYPPDTYPPGPYQMQVRVSVCYFQILCHEVTSNRVRFNITDILNGQIDWFQNGVKRIGDFVSNVTAVTHKIDLLSPDDSFLKNNATSIMTHWFIDCAYFGVTPGLTFSHKYDEVDVEHNVEALVVAGFEPITTPAPTTTTTTTTTTKSTTTTTTKTTTPTTKTTTPTTTTTKSTTTTTTPTPTTTTTKAITTTTKSTTITTGTVTPIYTTTATVKSEVDQLSNQIHKGITKRETKNVSSIVLGYNDTFIPFGQLNYSSVCLNETNIITDPNKTYGYFSRKIIVKAPVNNITVIGNNWLQHGDILSLQVKCLGSKPFYYCKTFIPGVHNVTGNETCIYNPTKTNTCAFNISRYYVKPGENTIFIIIQNDVGKIVYPVIVNVYKVTKRPQLSVIVVPVSFSLVAVVLIVFGMAYYIQNRRRFTVEVADFDFGPTCSEMEYKTFRERLKDSITNALIRSPTTEAADPPTWAPSSRKYGSMT